MVRDKSKQVILEKKRKELAGLREELKEVERMIDDCLEGNMSEEEETTTQTMSGRTVKRTKFD